MTYDLIITDSHVMTPNGIVEKNIVIEETNIPGTNKNLLDILLRYIIKHENIIPNDENNKIEINSKFSIFFFILPLYF